MKEKNIVFVNLIHKLAPASNYALQKGQRNPQLKKELGKIILRERYNEKMDDITLTRLMIETLTQYYGDNKTVLNGFIHIINNL